MTVNNADVAVESQSPDQSAEAEVLEKQVSTPNATDTSTEESAPSTEQPTSDSATVEDSFMGKDFDPKSLEGKPELEKAYKQMQSNWTKKNQDFTSRQGEYDQLTDWKKDLESNPYFQQWATDMERMAKMQKAGDRDISNMTEEERINFKVDERLQAYMDDKINPRVKTLEQERATARVDKFLTDNPNAKEYAVKISNLMKQHPTLDMGTAWKLIKSDFAKDDAKKEVLGELEVKGNANLEMPGKQASQPARKAKMTVEESAELASRQTGISWDSVR